MPRNSLGALVLTCLAGVVYFTALPSSQGPSRQDREIINGREVAAREALIRFRDQARRPELADLRATDDVETVEQIGGVVRVRSRSIDAASLVERMSRRGDVLYAEPNYIVRAFSIPADASFPQLWGLENTGQVVGGAIGTAGADIRAVPAWDVSVGSTAHVVAVIDTGIDYNHSDLAPNIWAAPAAFTVDLGEGSVVGCPAGTHGFNAITRSCNPMDDHGHGTHVAGTIGAAGNNGIGVVGVNWTTRLLGIKFLDATGSGTVADAIAGIRFAVAVKRAFPGAADVRVLSASWGGFDFSQALADEIASTQAEEMLFVAAAGNYGLNNDLLPTYPASYQAANIVAVAATTNTDGRAFFSNYGPGTVHLGAPGVDILSTIPGNNYSFSSGTSMAAPHVSGAAALVLSRCMLSTSGLKDALIGTVQPTDALATVTITGGRLDVYSAIHTCIAPPPAPDLTAIGGDGYVRLSWKNALGATGYGVRRGLSPGGPYTTIVSDVKGGGFVDSNVTNGTTYYYVVSASNPLGESADSNEASATPNAPSDLVVSALTAPSSVSAGSPVGVSVTTTNNGLGPAPATTTRIYLSVNASFDSSDILLEPAQLVPALAVGQSNTGALSVTVPPETAAGTKYLIAIADADRRAEEKSELNNSRVRSIAIGPDLIVSALDAPAVATAGESVSVTDTVKNQGAGAAAASTTSFYLSANTVLDGDDTNLGVVRVVPGLQSGVSHSGSSSVTIPTNTVVGTYYLIAKTDGGDAVVESSELNNTAARAIRIGGDLVVTTFSAPTLGGAGVSVSVTDTTTNQGTGGTPASITRFYLSINAVFDAGDTALGERIVASLPAGAGSSGTTVITIPVTTQTGSYYLLAIADAAGTVDETLESNNRSARGFAVGPDLRVATLEAPASAAGGATIVVGDTTHNQGGGSSPTTTTSYFFSANTFLDAQDVFLGSRQAPGLAPGGTHAGSVTVTIPGDVTAATYYILAKADGADSVAETQEANNVASRSIVVGGDLRVSAFSAPAKGGAGLAVVVSDTTANQGTASVTASRTRFYLSPNAGLDATDIVFSSAREVPALVAGESSAGSTTLTLPSGLAVGTYYLFAKADGDGQIAETQEANNTALRSIQIGPDLAVASLAVPTEAAGGSVITATDVTVNQGGGDAQSSTTGFFLSADTTLDASDILLDSSRSVAGLVAGASSTGTTTLTVPTSTTPGAYYVIASADGNRSVTETVEANNTRVQSIRIGPDLAVSSASLVSSTVQAGATVTVSTSVINQGAGVAGPTTLRFYLSLNTTFSPEDVLVTGSRDVPALAADATSAGSTAVTIPAGTSAATYYLLAVADADGSTAESLENNNVKIVRSIKVIASF